MGHRLPWMLWLDGLSRPVVVMSSLWSKVILGYMGVQWLAIFCLVQVRLLASATSFVMLFSPLNSHRRLCFHVKGKGTAYRRGKGKRGELAAHTLLRVGQRKSPYTAILLVISESECP